MNTALDIFFGTADPLWISISLFRVLGYFFLFRKCLLKPILALIPCLNAYYLGVCGKREGEGKVLFVIEVLEILARILVDTLSSKQETFLYLGMGLVLALLIAEVVFRMRIWRGLCKVFGRRRRWLFLWFFAEGFTSLLWGLKDEFQVQEDIEDQNADPAVSEQPEESAARYYQSRVRTLRKDADEDFVRRISNSGRLGQIGACIWRTFKAVIFDNDWMVFPLSAIIIGVIAALVSDDLFLTMEGTLKGTYALVLLSIWNGCFHSLQAVVRDRKVLLEGKKVGIHYTSYLLAQMFYQALLCLGQTVLLLYIFYAVGIRFPEKGMFTEWFSLELGLTIFLVTYCADMLGLLISAIAPSKAGAMTTMPFILIAQFVLAGGIIALPDWAGPVQDLMPSHYGVTAIGAQGDYNSLPMVTGWNVLNSLRDYELGGTITLQELLDYLSGEGEDEDDQDSILQKIRSSPIVEETTVGEILQMLRTNENLEAFRQKKVLSLFTVDELLDLLEEIGAVDLVKDYSIGTDLTFGAALDYLRTNPDLEKIRQNSITVQMTVGQIIDAIGEDQIKELLLTKTAEAARMEQFERSEEKVLECWSHLLIFALIYAGLTLLAIEIVCRGILKDFDGISEA